MKESRLAAGGTNLFQAIKAKCAEAEAAGIKLIKLSIGQPAGPALLSAREAAARAVMSGDESTHEYQDNGTPGVPDFAPRFVQANIKTYLTSRGGQVAFLPIPGIKPILGLVPLACGATAKTRINVRTATKPGYPTPADWCYYLGDMVWHHPICLNPENSFRFSPDQLDKEPKPHLVMMNYPHNPSGQVASREWLEQLCTAAEQLNIRLFNDAAYTILAHSDEHCTLTDVAIDFPGLSWSEAFSASKAGNFTGWRIGAMVGSPDFIGDIARIKGNTDSGFAAPLAAGVIHAFENDRAGIEAVRQTYARRLEVLIEILTKHGLRLAVQPGAGFFTLWHRPKRAFGQEIKTAEQFNFLMIEKTGVVGVHFDPYIRYAVCTDVEAAAEEIDAAFAAAEISY